MLFYDFLYDSFSTYLGMDFPMTVHLWNINVQYKNNNILSQNESTFIGRCPNFHFLNKQAMSNSFLVHFICRAADSPKGTTRAGKVRGMFLPPEYELTKFISDVQNVHESWNTTTPACEWNGVTCSEEGKVSRIAWKTRGLSGILHWSSIPRSVTSIDLSDNQLSGSVIFASLPPGLERMWLQENMFTGELQLDDLPPTMRTLNIGANQFTGFVDLSFMKDSKITGFDITGNTNLQGSIPNGIQPKSSWWGIPADWVQN